MGSKASKHIFFGILMAILLFPLVFQSFSGTITEPLKGYQPQAKKVDFNEESVLDGSWQKYAEAYTKDHLQTKHFLIRLNNQLKFSLFDELNANSVERGINDYYFERRYMRAHFGLRVRGDERMKAKVDRLQELTDSLNAHGIKSLFVIASGKAHFMPEELPMKYDTAHKRVNDYETLLKFLKQSSIPYLDMNKYLVDMKDTTSYPLYTKGNTHWSFYAISYVTDTLLSTMETLLERDLPDYQREPVRLAYEPTYYTEGGIFKSLNLYWTELQDTFAYRDVAVDKIIYDNKYRPKVWVIGDSYYGTLETYQIPQQFFDPSSIFFYYNGSIVGTLENKDYEPGNVKSYLNQMNEQDIIIYFTTDAGIEGCCWSAEEEMLEYYKGRSAK